MIKHRIYLDTSVIGGYFDTEFQEWSKLLFKSFIAGEMIAVISDITLDELENARAEIRSLLQLIPEEFKEFILKNTEVEQLANTYLKEGAITKKFYEDALHIAIATIHKVDVLVSWNFKHIVNLERINKYNGVNVKHGYTMLEIRNPRDIVSGN